MGRIPHFSASGRLAKEAGELLGSTASQQENICRSHGK